ncbi:MAG: o-succinylbenzoate--CoA ligase [Candidatus Geothermincolia bacterium]
MNVGEWTTIRARLDPDRQIVVCDDGRTFTNIEFNRRVNKLANSLADVGITRGERVAALFPNNPEFLELLFAAGKVGAIMVPLNFRLAPPELAYILDDCGANVLVYTHDFAFQAAALKELATGVKHFIAVGQGNEGDTDYEAWISPASDAEPEVPREVTLDDPHFIMYTSGTTGRPKGAVLTHGNTLWNGVNAILMYTLSEADTNLVAAPLFHIGGLSAAATPTIYSGGKVVLTRFFVPDQVLEFIEKYGVTTMFGIPIMFLLMSMSEKFETTDMSSIRAMIAGGAPCPVPLIEKYQDKGVVFSQGYGLTETAPAVSALPEDDIVRKRGSAGKPCFHVEIKIFDEEDKELPQGEMGEIVIKGPNVFKEYWKMPEETARALKDGWFHTGDMGRMDEEGYLYIVDRKKDMIISGGENIYPAEVEECIFAHPMVADVGVVGMHDQKWGEAPLALVVRVEGQEPSEEDIINFCKDRLARYKTPKKVIFVDELPRTPTGKILKKELRAMYVEGGDRSIVERTDIGG